jgi:hypothetical protein
VDTGVQPVIASQECCPLIGLKDKPRPLDLRTEKAGTGVR